MTDKRKNHPRHLTDLQKLHDSDPMMPVVSSAGGGLVCDTDGVAIPPEVHDASFQQQKNSQGNTGWQGFVKRNQLEEPGVDPKNPDGNGWNISK